MGDQGVPIDIRRPGDRPAVEEVALEIAEPLGQAAAAVLRYHAAVLDREDRLESGTGDWLDDFAEDPDARQQAMRHAVLRALHLATDPANFAILDALALGTNRTPAQLMDVTGLGRLPLAERVADLVSAGLAAKIPEADQVAATAAGAALVVLVREATEVGERDLSRGLA